MKMRFVVWSDYNDGESVKEVMSEIYEIEIKKTRDGKFSQDTIRVLEHVMERVDLFGERVTLERVR